MLAAGACALVVAQGCALLAGVDDDLGLLAGANDGGPPGNDAASAADADAEDGARPLSLFVGALGGSGSLDGEGTSARIGTVTALAFRDAERVLVLDRDSARIRELHLPTRRVTTLAGRGMPGEAAADGADGGVIENPYGLVFDGARTVSFTDGHAIRTLDLESGALRTLTGAVRTSGTTDGPLAVARFSSPTGLGVIDDRVYVCEYSSHRVRELDLKNESVRTFAGGVEGYADGYGDGEKDGGALFRHPTTCARADGQLIVGDYSSIRIYDDATRTFNTAVGSAAAGDVEAAGAAARLRLVRAIAGGDGVLFFGDSNGRIKSFGPAFSVTTAAGSSERGSVDGPAAEARFGEPWALAVDGERLVIGDATNFTLRVFDRSTSTVTTLAGLPPVPGAIDGVGAAARLSRPHAIVRTASGDLVVSDVNNHTLRRVTQAGEVTTLIGRAGEPGRTDGFGEEGRLWYPYGLAYDAETDAVFVTERTGPAESNAIRRVDLATRHLTTVVSNPAGEEPVDVVVDGSGGTARLKQPTSIALHDGALYLVEHASCRIRKVEPATQTVTTVVGAAACGGNDGQGGAARLAFPRSILHVGDGRFYLADNTTLRLVVRTRGATAAEDVYAVTTLAGAYGVAGHADGVGPYARLYAPESLTLDNDGTILFSDSHVQVVRRFDPKTLAVTTVAGMPYRRGVTLGELPGTLSAPGGLAVEPDGRIRIVQQGENAILTLSPGRP